MVKDIGCQEETFGPFKSLTAPICLRYHANAITQPRKKALFLLVGPGLAVLVGGLCVAGNLSSEEAFTAGVTTLCAVWWVLEPIPIGATSLLPFALLPLGAGISHKQVAAAFGNHMLLLLLGGFLLSRAVEKSGAHRRIALGMVRITGTNPRRVVLGFMLASALCSMWISNTATTLMLLPVALAVVESREDDTFTPALLLGIAYAASIGGMSTPIGTPPNVIFMAAWEQHTGTELSFLTWMFRAVPIVLLILPMCWLWLTRKLNAQSETSLALPPPSPWTTGEKRVLLVFAATALAWVSRTLPSIGWGQYLPFVGDSTIALFSATALFIIRDGDNGSLLDWKTAVAIPWELLLLFAGGIAIASAFQSSGLALSMGNSLTGLADQSTLIMIACIALAVTFMTELTSNLATTTLLMPILAAAATAAEISPDKLMIPATISASCAFMLPVATAPNAIVYGSGKVTVAQMSKEGLVLNFAAAAIITVLCTALL